MSALGVQRIQPVQQVSGVESNGQRLAVQFAAELFLSAALVVAARGLP
jgi:hypothetical protein